MSGEQIRLNLFQATGGDCEARVVISGGVMTPDGAVSLAHYLHELAYAALAAEKAKAAIVDR